MKTSHQCVIPLRRLTFFDTNQNRFKIDPLKLNGPYRGRTALLTSKVAFYIFIQQM